MTREVPAAGTIPVIVPADLQSPSGAGWTAAGSGAHCGVGPVAWPVPAHLDAAGLKDSFRAANPDAAKAPGNTWSPIVATHPGTGTREPQDRIDYIHFAGDSLKVRGSNTLVAGWPSSKNIPGNSWTSNQFAVASTFSLGTPMPPNPAPVVTLAKANIALHVGSTTTADESRSAAGASSTTEGATFQLDLGSTDFTTPGSHTVQVTATDPATGQVSQPVGVVVQIVPVITVSPPPAAALTLAHGQELTAAGVESTVQPSLNVPGTVTVDLPKVTQGVGGRYVVAVTGTDGHGFTAPAKGSAEHHGGHRGHRIPERNFIGLSDSHAAPDRRCFADREGERLPIRCVGVVQCLAQCHQHRRARGGLASTGSDEGLRLTMAALFLLLGALALAAPLVMARRRASH